MNTLSNLKMPRAVCCGEGALKKDAGDPSGGVCEKNAAVFTDKGIRSAGLLDPVLEQLQKSQAAFCVLDDLPPEPSYGQVQKLVDACRAEGADMILAVGGGSVMDTAKLAGVLLDGSSTVHDLLEAPGRAKKMLSHADDPHNGGHGQRSHAQCYRSRAGAGAEGGHRQRRDDRRQCSAGPADDQKSDPGKLRRPQVWTLWRTPSNVTQAIRQIPSAILLRWKRWI